MPPSPAGEELALRVSPTLTGGTRSEELGVVRVNCEADLRGRPLDDRRGRRCHGIHQLAAADAEGMIVPIDAAVEATRVIAK